jgi:membrane peptidoglycan carboxypeptidase
VVALVGGRDYLKSQQNWATTKAPPGTLLRPFALADGTTGKDLDRQYFDLVDARQGELISKAAEAAGIPRIPTADRAAPGLGPDPLASPLDLAGAYATFIADGRWVRPHVIKEVRDSHGKVLWSADKLRPVQALMGDAARGIDSVLMGGKGASATGLSIEKRQFNRKCRCKKYRGARDTLASWWVGYTPELSTAVLYRAGKAGESNLAPYGDDKRFLSDGWPAATWSAYAHLPLTRAAR